MDLDFLKNIGGKEKNFDINMFREELANKLKEMEKKYTIDRFEGNIAICEERESGEIIEIPKDQLPKNIKEGIILKKGKDGYEIDLLEEQEVQKRIKDKMDKLWD